jgi:hypothetical protein
MSANSDFKLLKEKKIDKDTTLKITRSLMSGRIFVEFTSVDPKIVLQRNFQDNYYGRLESEEFSKSIRSTEQLRERFGIRKVEV